MLTIDRYLTGRSLRAIALVAASLTSMLLLFALFDELAEGACLLYTSPRRRD